MFAFTTRLGANAPGLPAMPPPAPLPSLPTAFSRRAAIFGAAATTGVLVGSAARALAPLSPVPADDMPCLYAEARALRAAADQAVSDAEVDHLADRLTALEQRAIAARVTTPAGAVAALEWVRSDLERDEGAAAGLGFYPAMVAQALGVLRTMGDAR